MINNNKKIGKLFVIAGPSGVGKGTLVKMFVESIKDNIYLSTSATTRKPRIGEQQGKNYIFLDKKIFEQKIRENQFIEYAKYADNYYGTLKKPILQKIEQGINVILEIDTQGAWIIKNQIRNAVLIFVEPPNFKVLEKRLRMRNTESKDKIIKRLKISKNEINKKYDFDFTIINDNLENAVKQLKYILLDKKNV